MRESRGGKERVRDGGERLRIGDGRERKCERVWGGRESREGESERE